MVNILLAALIIMTRTLYDAGEFKSIKPHFDGECIVIEGVVGAEDIILINHGLALISSDNRRETLQGNNIQGSLFLYDINLQSLTNITPSLEFEFHPHGISIFHMGDMSIQIAAVNHRSNEQTIEIFNLKNQVITHIKTIRDKHLISPNDIVLIDEYRFYMTNDHAVSDPMAQKFYDYLQIPRSNVVFYDGERFKVVAKGLTYANGINVSKDTKSVYVAECVGRELSIFSRDLGSNNLKHELSIPMKSSIDNIELDNDGSLWIGSHPKALAFTRHAKNEKKLSPSQVIKVTLDNEDNQIEEIYLNDGKLLSGSSVAAVFNNHLLIGAVFDERFLHCTMDEQP